jgi:serine/threonine-protein kinase
VFRWRRALAQQPKLLLEGKYEILAKIREGGMGSIYRVRHRLLDEVRVIKVMQPHVVADADLKRRFLEEAKTAIRLKHPNICTLHDYAVDEDGTAYLVMEYIDGANLSDLLRLRGSPGLALSIEIAHQALLALGYLHRKGVIHRDIAPDNLMLTHDEENRPLVKLIDLGIAKAANRSMDMTATGVFLGKLKYASPEQYGTLAPGEKIDGRSDIYGLGVVLYELLTGVRPFKGESPAELLRAHLFTPPLPFSDSDPEGKIPEEVRAVILKALEKKREDRHASAEDFDREVVGLREVHVRPEDLQTAMAVFAAIRSTQPAGPDTVTPSAQNRLDRQFGPQTTPSPSLPPFKIVMPPDAEQTAIQSPAGVPIPRETEASRPTLPAEPGAADQTAIHPMMAAERASADARTAAEPPRPADRPPPPKPLSAPEKGKLPTATPSAGAKTLAIGPAAKGPAPEPRRRRALWAGLLVTAAAILLLWRPWSARAPRPVSPSEPEAAPSAAPEAVEATVSAPEPTALPTTVPTAAPTAAPPTPVPDRPLRAGAETARQAALRARRSAEQARARDLAPSTYRAAVARQAEAERLLSRAEDGPARAAFESAAGLFGQAAESAEQERLAQLRPSPVPVIPTAIPPTPIPPPPTAAPTVPRPEATRVPAVEREVVPTAAPPVRGNPAEERRIRETVRLYEQAWSRFDAKLYERVYPSGVDAFHVAIKNLNSQYVNIEIRRIDVDASGTRAEVGGNEIIVATPKAGAEQRTQRDVVLELEKRAAGWIISSRR